MMANDYLKKVKQSSERQVRICGGDVDGGVVAEISPLNTATLSLSLSSLSTVEVERLNPLSQAIQIDPIAPQNGEVNACDYVLIVTNAYGSSSITPPLNICYLFENYFNHPIYICHVASLVTQKYFSIYKQI